VILGQLTAFERFGIGSWRSACGGIGTWHGPGAGCASRELGVFCNSYPARYSLADPVIVS